MAFALLWSRERVHGTGLVRRYLGETELGAAVISFLAGFGGRNPLHRDFRD